MVLLVMITLLRLNEVMLIPRWALLEIRLLLITMSSKANFLIVDRGLMTMPSVLL